MSDRSVARMMGGLVRLSEQHQNSGQHTDASALHQRKDMASVRHVRALYATCPVWNGTDRNFNTSEENTGFGD